MSTATQEQIPVGYVSPGAWIKLKQSGSYADPNMLMDANGQPLTSINFCNAHLALQRICLRSIDDAEFNDLVNSNPEAAKQMRRYAVWTSCLRDVERAEGGYNAKHIARPEVSIVDGEYAVKGSEKPTKLPKGGYFKISHILQSDDGLPHETFDSPPDEPWAYFIITEGKERPVYRGVWHGDWPSDTSALWGPFVSDPDVGVRAAGDEEPKSIVVAKADCKQRRTESH